MNVQELITETREVDTNLELLVISRKFLLRIAKDQRWYERSIIPTAEFLQRLRERRIDIFMLLERSWTCNIHSPQKSWAKTEDNVALLYLKSYDEWWKSICKKTRNVIRKAGREGIRTSIAEPDEKLAEGIWRIYNETPIRQERSFLLFGTDLQEVKTSLNSEQNCTYVGAYLQDELAGFMRLIHGDNIIIISQILSLKKLWNKAINNALIAKAIEVCASENVKWMLYGRMGDFSNPSLDKFKQSNGFSRFQVTRYYVPITRKGKLAIKLGLYKEAKEMLPRSMKCFSIPIYNWLSRCKIRTKLYLRPRAAD